MTPAPGATVVVELTSPGRAAVAVVLVAGPDALRACQRCFVPRSGQALAEIPLGRIALGCWGDEAGEELILCRQSEAQIEIHCHGGAAAVRAVISGLLNEGCRSIPWQDWIRQYSVDPIRADAQIALADAVTERTAAILLDQFNGALSAAVGEVLATLSTANWSAAANVLDELLARQLLGLHLTKPWRVVVFGAPNVGKSSLINAVAGFERAIVTPSPGTTRDVVSVTTAVEGWPVQLSDTAGFRETQDELESAGIELATRTLSQADIAVFVHDAAKLNYEDPLEKKTTAAWPTLASHARTVHVINKIDLVSDAERIELTGRWAGSKTTVSDPQFISALTGEGIAQLLQTIGRVLVPISLPPGAAVPFTVNQIEGLAAARAAVAHRDPAAAHESLQALLTPAS